MKSIEEFKSDEKHYIVFNNIDDFTSFLKEFNPLYLSKSHFQLPETTIAADGTYCTDIKYMKLHYKFYCNYADLNKEDIYGIY